MAVAADRLLLRAARDEPIPRTGNSEDLRMRCLTHSMDAQSSKQRILSFVPWDPGGFAYFHFFAFLVCCGAQKFHVADEVADVHL